MSDKPILYKCQDPDCGKILEEYMLLPLKSPTRDDPDRIIYKCSKCRGRVKPVEADNE